MRFPYKILKKLANIADICVILIMGSFMNGSAKRFRQETDKIKELILYISRECAGTKHFGMVKLNKMIFASDRECYAQTGRPITGAQYKKQKQGPTLYPMVPILKEMVKAGEVEIVEEMLGEWPQKRTIAKREPNLSVFSKEELCAIGKWIRKLQPLTASQVRDLFHEEAFWELLQYKDSIPYGSVFWEVTNPSDIVAEDREDAKRVLEKNRGRRFTRPTTNSP